MVTGFIRPRYLQKQDLIERSVHHSMRQIVQRGHASITGKQNTQKLEQPNNLSPEIRCSKHRDHVTGQREEKTRKSGHKKHFPPARTSVVHHSTTSKRIRKKVRVYDWYHHKFIS